MTDPTQFVVQFSAVHGIMRHQGVLGSGRDFLTGKQCIISSYTDNINKSYIMQLYESNDPIFISNKLGSIAKAINSYFVSNLTRIIFMCSRKNSKGAYELCIFYDVSGLGGTSLNTILSNKRIKQQRFTTDQIIQCFWQLSDLLLLCSKDSLQYLQLTPINIFYSCQVKHGYKYYPNNLGINYMDSKCQKYHNPKDIFWQGNRNPESAIRAAMFIFGMTLLEIVSMLQTQSLYQYGLINVNALHKRIQAVKITNDPMICQVIEKLLTIDEYQRITLQGIINHREWMKLRKVNYVQAKNDFYHYKSFRGILDQSHQIAVGEAIDQNFNTFRGTFHKSNLQGAGIREMKDSITQMGVFDKSTLIQGLQLHHNQHLTIGWCKDGEIVRGHRFVLSTNHLQGEGSMMVSYSGYFNNKKPSEGTIYYKDGQVKNI